MIIKNNIATYVGRVVRSKGTIKNLDGSTTATINEALPDIELCSAYKDKAVYGVISDTEEEGKREYAVGTFVSVFNKGSDADRLIVNAVGEGGIWVSDEYGAISNGDLITTGSDAYGVLQDDDIFHSYTVAKATQDAVFEDGKAFIGCTYHCG